MNRLSAFLERTGPILLVALLLRAAAAVLIPLPEDWAAQTDSGLTALNLVEGRGYVHDFYGRRPDNPLQSYMPPLHVLYASASLIFPNPQLAQAVQQVIVGTLAVFLVHRLAQGMGGRLMGGLAGWAMALYPAYVIMTSIPESVVLFVAGMAAFLLLAWLLWQKPSALRAALTGAMLGILALGRPHVLLLLPFVVLWLAVRRPRSPRLWRDAAIVCLATGLILVPWIVRNWLVLERPVFLSTNGGRTAWLGNNPFTTGSGGDVYADRVAAYLGIEPDPAWPEVFEYPGLYPLPHTLEESVYSLAEVDLDRAFYRAAMDYVRQHPGEWLELEVQKLVSFWWFRPNLGANPHYQDLWTALYRVLYAGLVLLALGGLVLSLRQWRRYVLLYGVLISYTVVYAVFHVLTRFRWEIEFILLIFASLAVAALWTRYAPVAPSEQAVGESGAVGA